MSRITLIDVANRPKAPPIAGATPADRRRGQRLALYHRMHLDEMDRVRALIDTFRAGAAAPPDLAAAIAGLDMVQNYRLFGAVCGRECQMLTFHHTGEDTQLFPAVRQLAPALARVVDKLAAEHEVIHALIDELQSGADAITQRPDAEAFEALVATFDDLDEIVRSHFGYEETELAEALGVHDLI
jgi:hypothetical protein